VKIHDAFRSIFEQELKYFYISVLEHDLGSPKTSLSSGRKVNYFH